MSERLIIENFACLKKVDMEFAPINVLIGPQASGKSLIAKLLYYFRSFPEAMVEAVSLKQDIAAFLSTRQKTFCEFFPVPMLGRGDFHITYAHEGHTLDVCRASESGQIEVQACKEFAARYHAAEARFRELLSAKAPDDNLAYRLLLSSVRSRDISEQLGNPRHEDWLPYRKQTFIAAGRSFLGVLRANLSTLVRTGIAIDPFVLRCNEAYEIALQWSRHYDSASLTKDQKHPHDAAVDSLSRDILKGSREISERDESIVSSDGRKTPLLFASSGQQEAFPLLVILAANAAFQDAIYLEEPEAHLFPQAQANIVEIIARCFLDRGIPPSNYTITTHSPYILSAFNNLLFAGELYQKADAAKKRKLRKLVPPECALPPGSVGAFAVDKGTVRSILQPDTGLISGEEIDGVSFDIGIVFDKLLDLSE